MIFDRSERTIVAVCACGAREIFLKPADADTWAVAHLAVCTDRKERAHALTASRARHARTPR
jgi:hypothetical protein